MGRPAHGVVRRGRDRRHSGLPRATATRSRTVRCRIATSGPSTRPARSRCSCCRRSLSDDEEGFRDAFEWLMAACGAAMVLLTGVALAGLRATRSRTVLVLALAACFPLLLGSVVLTRFDLWPAVLVAGALAALVHGRDRLGFGVLGAAVAVKLYPAVLVPVAAAYVWRRRGPARGDRLPRPARGRRRARLPPVPRRRARRRRAQHRPPALAAAPDREPRLGALSRGAPSARARRRDALGARLAEPARDRNRSRGGAAQPGPDRQRSSGSGRAGPERPRSSFAGAPRLSSRSLPSGRCSRRSS